MPYVTRNVIHAKAVFINVHNNKLIGILKVYIGLFIVTNKLFLTVYHRFKFCFFVEFISTDVADARYV